MSHKSSSLNRFARPSDPTPQSRYAARQQELQKQEQLLLEKKREVEAKLSAPSSSKACTSSESECKVSNVSSVADTHTEAHASDYLSLNKFQNNGSFLDMFRAMQKEKGHKTSDQSVGIQNQIKAEKEDFPGCSKAEIESKDAKLDAIEKCATFVAMNGQETEEQLKERFRTEDGYKWLFDEESIDHKYYKHRVLELQSAGQEAEVDPARGDASPQAKKRKKSRWGSESETLPLDADLMQYAVQVFGTVELEEHQWRQLEDQRKMRMLTEIMKEKQKEATKYEYDSDEEVEGGTWEHKRRLQEMETTRENAENLTNMNRGKHHIGDFLPPDELSRFLSQWEMVKEGKAPASWDNNYEQFKVESNNMGYRMMQQMGWKEGESLGGDSESSIKDPIACRPNAERRGLGSKQGAELREGDDEFEAYRKRMMVAYRFRPNPLNNPRRNYY